MQRTVTHSAQARHEVTLPTNQHEPFATRVGIFERIRHIVRSTPAYARGHKIQRLRRHSVLFLPFAHIVIIALLEHVSVQTVSEVREPHVVVLAERAEDGYLVPAILAERETNRQVEYGVRRLMHPEVLIRRVKRTAGRTQERVVGVPHFAVHIVGAEITYIIPGVGHPVVTQGETELKPPYRFILHREFGQHVRCDD